jgi:hypothetical protein
VPSVWTANAGVPHNDLSWFCPENGTSCYYYNAIPTAYDSHKAACQSLGGYIVALNTGLGQPEGMCFVEGVLL